MNTAIPANRTGAIIQARMSSNRLPGKMLREINARPLLAYLLDRVKKLDFLCACVVATSTDKDDDAIEDFCRDNSIECYRGSLNNVSDRMAEVAGFYELDAFFRICGDSPLVDLKLFYNAYDIYNDGEYDLVTNVFPRSYPPGQSVELVRTSSYTDILSKITDPEDQEHVTRFFYKNANNFHIYNIYSNEDFSGIKFVVDSEEDLEKVSGIVRAMSKPHWQYNLEELVGLYKTVKSVVNTA